MKTPHQFTGWIRRVINDFSETLAPLFSSREMPINDHAMMTGVMSPAPVALAALNIVTLVLLTPLIQNFSIANLLVAVALLFVANFVALIALYIVQKLRMR